MSIHFILLVFVCFSCKSESKIQLESSFFDMSQFVDSLLMEDRIYSEVTRTIKLDGEEEKKVLLDVDMTDVFGFLKQFNINRPRWYDKYNVKKESSAITYSAISDEYDVQEMKITKEGSEISHIEILYRSKTLISNSEKKVTWFPKSQLKFTNSSKSLWSKEQNVDMSWTY